MNQRIKIAAIGVPLVASGFIFGRACAGFDQAFAMLLSPSSQLVEVLVWFLLGVSAVLFSVELAAALVRPLWLGFGLFALGALAMLLSCPVTAVAALLASLYLVGSALYSWRAARELEGRINFSVGALAENQGVLVAVLVLAASAHVYVSSSQHIQEQGLSVPESFLEAYGGWMEQRIVEEVPLQDRARAVAEFRREFRSQMEAMFDELVNRYGSWIPLVVAAGVFMTLETIVGFVSWIPGLFLGLVFPLLGALRVTEVITEMREVERVALR